MERYLQLSLQSSLPFQALDYGVLYALLCIKSCHPRAPLHKMVYIINVRLFYATQAMRKLGSCVFVGPYGPGGINLIGLGLSWFPPLAYPYVLRLLLQPQVYSRQRSARRWGMKSLFQARTVEDPSVIALSTPMENRPQKS